HSRAGMRSRARWHDPLRACPTSPVQGSSSIGRAIDSKSIGCGFDSCLPCHLEVTLNAEVVAYPTRKVGAAKGSEKPVTTGMSRLRSTEHESESSPVLPPASPDRPRRRHARREGSVPREARHAEESVGVP